MASANSSESDLLTKELKEPIPLAEYLFRRLKEMGVETIHGVPGDYNLTALDFVAKTGLKWAGNCNELNAGYAADGYARVKGMGAIVTTFGVGELSALNALAGAYSEFVPVVHIVGQPTTAAQADSLLLHHTLGNGDYNAFVNMSRPISAEIAALKNPHEAAAQIDHALQTCWQKSRPVYIALPTDLTFKKVEGARLKTPINLEHKPNDAEQEKYVVDVVLNHLHAAKNPVILVDACAIRHRVLEEVHALVKTSGLPTFVTPMGKGAVDETLPNYGGVYAGDGSNAGVRERVESSDLVLSIGGIKSDFNTAGFTYKVSQLNTIDFHSDHIQVKYSMYPGVRMSGVLSAVIKDIESSMTQDEQGRHRSTSLSVKPGPTPSNDIPSHLTSSTATTDITHSWFWPRIGQWLAAGDIVLTETGTANFGIWETRFAKDVVALSQVLWGSIGYSVGAMQGAAQAASEIDGGKRRTILFVGDGSFQLTAQEVSTAIRLGLKPIIFVICNQGYTIERYIHGWKDPYNDVQEWSYKSIPATFGAPPSTYTTHVVKTRAELDTLLGEKEFCMDGKDGKLRFVELHMPWDDAPNCLKSTAAAAAARNA